jgi:hypothetical protein
MATVFQLHIAFQGYKCWIKGDDCFLVFAKSNNFREFDILIGDVSEQK